ncbi:MAG: carbohydrate ABC transporter permease [Saccharofermentanales bacterium]
MKPRLKVYDIVVYILLLNLSFIFLYPFLYMIATSFKSYSDLMDVTVKWYPREFSPSNWAQAFSSLGLPGTMFNSIFVSGMATIGHLLACSFVAYGFARYRFPFKNLIFALVVLTIIVPVQTIIVPQYVLFSKMSWVGSYFPMIVPAFVGFGLKGGLFIFLFRQFFLRLPPALEEAAAIDGCNPYRTFVKIILPTSGPVILVSLILSVVWHWNDFFEPSIYINEASRYLLPQALPGMYEFFRNLQSMVSENDIKLREVFHQGVLMAGTFIAVLPLLIMYLFVQNKFVESIDRTGIVE